MSLTFTTFLTYWYLEPLLAGYDIGSMLGTSEPWLNEAYGEVSNTRAAYIEHFQAALGTSDSPALCEMVIEIPNVSGEDIWGHQNVKKKLQERVMSYDAPEVYILAIREVAPALGLVEKWVVLESWGKNHRLGLFDMMRKGNHKSIAGVLQFNKVVLYILPLFVDKGKWSEKFREKGFILRPQSTLQMNLKAYNFIIAANFSMKCNNKVHRQLGDAENMHEGSRYALIIGDEAMSCSLDLPSESLGSYCIYEHFIPCFMKFTTGGKHFISMGCDMMIPVDKGEYDKFFLPKLECLHKFWDKVVTLFKGGTILFMKRGRTEFRKLPYRFSKVALVVA